MTTQDMLDERYGRRRTPARRWRIGIGLAVVVVAVGAFGWMTYSSALDDVDAQDTAFHVIDDRTVSVEFQITAPIGRDVACALEAQDEQHGIVGWRIVQFPASQAHTQSFEEKIPTTAPATTGLINSCWVT